MRFPWLTGSAILWTVQLVLLCGSVRGEDWPEFRGRGRAGIWRETGILETLGRDVARPLWRVPVGAGYSGPTVADGRVYVMDRGAGESADEERVICVSSAEGKPLWTDAYPCRYGAVGYPLGPRASVTVEGGKAFALGTMGHLRCLDAARGTLLWSKTPGEGGYAVEVPIWGIACSPLVDGDLVIAMVGGRPGGCVVAYRTATGEEAWRALDDRLGYASPIIVEQAGRRVLVVWTGERVAGLDPKTGTLLWQHATPPRRMPINVGVPVMDETGERMLLSTFYDGARLLRLSRERMGVEELWCRQGASERETDALHAMISPATIRGGHIYGVDSYGELRCLDLATGDRVWEDRTAVPQARWGTAFMVVQGERTWMFTEAGELIEAELSPKGYREIGRQRLLEPTTALSGSGRRGAQGDRRERRVVWSHPAFAGGCIFARNDLELVCASLAAKR